MTIATIDDVAAGLAAPAQVNRFFKYFGAPKAAGSFQSGWLAAGVPGAGAASPVYTNGSGYTVDKSTAGALGYTNASVQNWLARLAAHASGIGTLILADRLWSCSGMGFAASTYSVTTPGSLPARITDNGVGCELWCEQFVAAGAASGTLTANYLEPGGASKAGVIAAVQSAPVAGQIQPVPLQSGDTGIKQLTSVVTSATWTSGSFGMTIAKRLAEINIAAIGMGGVLDWAGCALAQVPSDACLMFIWLANTTTAPVVIGSATIIDK